METFRYVSYAQEVIFAAGALSRVGEVAERHGWMRLMLCASLSMKAKGYVATIQEALGERLVAVFDCVQPHVRDVQVDEVLALACGLR